MAFWLRLRKPHDGRYNLSRLSNAAGVEALMLDLERIKRIRLYRRPPGQFVLANAVLAFDYRIPHPTRIILEGAENVPKDRGIFFAMNHTDRYNYWPFQYQLYRQGLGFTATWVKGKYFENRWLARFMEWTSNIPLPSRGYIIASRFRLATGRPPDESEYRLLRDLVDSRRSIDEPLPDSASAAVRELLGRDPAAFLTDFDQLFDAMIREVIRLNRKAIIDLHLNVLVFPQGTRSKRLLPGHTGMMQVAQHLGAAIVPVGCNGSDRAYPGNSPLSKGGRLVYRIGKPLELDGPELAQWRVPASAQPLSHAASREHGAAYKAATAVVMAAINELLDDEYRFADDDSGDAVRGMNRFL